MNASCCIVWIKNATFVLVLHVIYLILLNLVKKDAFAQIWKVISPKVVFNEWNQRNTMFAIALAFITEGDNTIAS